MLLAIGSLLLTLSIQANYVVERELPNHHEHFYDETGLFPENFKKRITKALEDYLDRYKKRINVVFLESLQGENIDSFSLRYMQKLSSEIEAPTAILIVGLSDRKVQVALNFKASHFWQSGGKRRILNAIKPHLREQNYESGITVALDHMAQAFDTNVRGSWLSRKSHKQTIIVLSFISLALVLLSGRTSKYKKKWIQYKRSLETADDLQKDS